jgi:signal transduction histidine kinase
VSADLTDERASRLAQANAILRISAETLSNPQQLDDFLGYVTLTSTQQLHAVGATVWMYDWPARVAHLRFIIEDGRVVRAEDSSHPYGRKPKPLSDGDYASTPGLGSAAARPTMQRIELDPAVPADARVYLGGRGVGALLTCPLIWSGEQVGAICFRFVDERPLPPEDIELVEALANQATLAVQLTRLAAEARQAEVERVRSTQLNALRGVLDALAREPSPERLLEFTLRTTMEQFGTHSLSVWCRDHSTGMIGLEYAFEGGALVGDDDPRFAGVNRWLPMEDLWPWPEVFRTGKASLIEDIRSVPPFPLRDRLLPMGIITVLLVPMTIAGRLEGAVGLRFREKRPFRPDELELAESLANQAMLAIQLDRVAAASRAAAVVAERNRMARDIHDTLAQGFTGVIVQLEAAEDARLRGLAPESDEHLRRARELARESLQEARRSVRALRPQALDGSSLCDALESLVERITHGTGTHAELLVIGEPRPLRPEWEENLYRICQELVTNVVRHARARHVVARLVFEPNEVRLDVRDDGVGFDSARRPDGHGLAGIEERVAEMGGQLAVRTVVGDGTTIMVHLPRTT